MHFGEYAESSIGMHVGSFLHYYSFSQRRHFSTAIRDELARKQSKTEPEL